MHKRVNREKLSQVFLIYIESYSFFYFFADEEGHHSPPESPIAHARKQQDYPPHCTTARTWPVFVHVLIVRKQLITPFPLKQQSPLLPKMEYFPYSNSDYVNNNTN